MFASQIYPPVRGTTDRGDGYEVARDLVAAAVTHQTGPLFVTDATGLGDLFLSKIPAASRGVYSCRSCLRFFDKYGPLVTISPDGKTSPLLSRALLKMPDHFRPAITAIVNRVAEAKITGVFYSDARTWGEPKTGPWSHFAVPVVPLVLRFKPTLLRNCEQAMAERKEEFGMLGRALAEFPREVAATAYKVLQSESLYRSEKVLGVCKWFHELHETLKGKRGKTRDALLWSAVASAPTGFCHVKSSMIGTLLTDIAAGFPFNDVKKRFDEKMNPTKYQRPQAAPKAGNVARAEKIFAELNAAGALERRFAKMTDVERIWTPRRASSVPQPKSVFGHLTPHAPPYSGQEPPPATMTFEKFRRVVLPDAHRIELFVDGARTGYSAMVTAVRKGVPNLMQWRDPVSWYVYSQGSLPLDWALRPYQWHDVTALVLKPHQWAGQHFPQHSQGVLFALKGCHDVHYSSGGGFFPEQLKAEYREVRATLESYVASAKIQDKYEAEVCGRLLQAGNANGWPVQLKINGQFKVNLDRWD